MIATATISKNIRDPVGSKELAYVSVSVIDPRFDGAPLYTNLTFLCFLFFEYICL